MDKCNFGTHGSTMLFEYAEHLFPTIETQCSEIQREQRRAAHAAHAALHMGLYENARHIDQYIPRIRITSSGCSETMFRVSTMFGVLAQCFNACVLIFFVYLYILYIL